MIPRRALPPAVGAVLLLAMLPAPSRADTVVFEAYAGERPSDAATLLAPLYAELTELGYSAEAAALETRIGTRVSQAAAVLSTSDFVQAIELVSRGYESWINGDFQTAVDDLSAGLKMFSEHPATIAMKPKHRDSVFKALVGLSLANARLGNVEEATSAMAELLRSFPDMEISRTEYGPEPREMYRKVKAELDERGSGSVRVIPDDDTVLVFVNGRYVGSGEQALEGLYPGRYRVFTRRGSTPGRVYTVEVAPGTEQTLSVMWGRDSGLRTRADFVGFEFGSDAERRTHEAEYASTLASQMGATGVVVVGMRQRATFLCSRARDSTR